MTIYIKGENLNAEDMKFYSKSFKGLKPTGETIKEISDNHSQTTVVFKGSWTPYGCIRDCGDHYIKALYSSYRWISKDLQTTREDVEDF